VWETVKPAEEVSPNQSFLKRDFPEIIDEGGKTETGLICEVKEGVTLWGKRALRRKKMRGKEFGPLPPLSSRANLIRETTTEGGGEKVRKKGDGEGGMGCHLSAN